MSLAQMATVSTIASNQNYTNNQLQAARDVNKIEYEQRVNSLNNDLVQVQLQQQQANLQAANLKQQNEKSYAEGLYSLLQQRVLAQEQATAGKEQGLQLQAANAQEGTAQYRDLLNQAFQYEAQMREAEAKNAQASLMTDPFSISNVVNDKANLNNLVNAYQQMRQSQGTAIGDDVLQTAYTNTIADIMRRLGINDSQLTGTMADINQNNLSSQYAANNAQIQQQQALNDQAFTQAQRGINDARSAEYRRYTTDDNNLTRLNQAQTNATNIQNSNAAMSNAGYTYRNGAWYQNNGNSLFDQAQRQYAGYFSGAVGGDLLSQAQQQYSSLLNSGVTGGSTPSGVYAQGQTPMVNYSNTNYGSNYNYTPTNYGNATNYGGSSNSSTTTTTNTQRVSGTGMDSDPGIQMAAQRITRSDPSAVIRLR